MKTGLVGIAIGHMLALATAATFAGGADAAKAKHAAPAFNPHNLAGFWELRDGSKNVPKPKLLDSFKGELPRYNKIVFAASRWCHPLGVPFIMGDSAPLDLIQDSAELAITAEVQSSARHIYLDGRKHPPMDEFEPTTNGHSIGRWEGNTLVVDTVGFSAQGQAQIPGGGLRGPNSHLVERYTLRDGGKQLFVQFSWTDPTVFAAPHSYDFTYYRARPGEYAREYFCDASDPARGESIHVPTQD